MKNVRVNEIDVIRFIAALMVVLYHYTFRGWAADSMLIVKYEEISQISRYGYLGVELFFMISGFVILMSAQSGGVKYFIISRFARIYPAFWICCSISAIVIYFLGGQRFNVTIVQYLVNMTLINGFVGIPSIDGVYWSLFIEIQFYIFVSIFLILRILHKIEFILYIWLVLLIIFFAFPVGFVNYLIMAKYGAYFISGAAFYLLWKNGLSARLGFLLFVSMIFAMFQSILSLNLMEIYFQASFNRWCVLGIIFSFYLIMLLISFHCVNLSSRINWLIVGGLTYPLYLIHQNIGYILLNYFSLYFDSVYVLIGVVLLVVVLSYLINNYGEKPLSAFVKRILNSRIS